MRLARAGLCALAIVVALGLLFVGGALTTNASDGSPVAGGAATAFLWIAFAGLALTLFMSGALLGEADGVAKRAFLAVLVADAGLLVVMLVVVLRA